MLVFMHVRADVVFMEFETFSPMIGSYGSCFSPMFLHIEKSYASCAVHLYTLYTAPA